MFVKNAHVEKLSKFFKPLKLYNMYYNIDNKDKVTFCFKEACINAFGKNGVIITIGAFALLLSIAMYYISKIK